MVRPAIIVCPGLCPGLLRGAGVLGPGRPPPAALLPALLLQSQVASPQTQHQARESGGLRDRSVLGQPEDSVEPLRESSPLPGSQGSGHHLLPLRGHLHSLSDRLHHPLPQLSRGGVLLRGGGGSVCGMVHL